MSFMIIYVILVFVSRDVQHPITFPKICIGSPKVASISESCFPDTCERNKEHINIKQTPSVREESKENILLCRNWTNVGEIESQRLPALLVKRQ